MLLTKPRSDAGQRSGWHYPYTSLLLLLVLAKSSDAATSGSTDAFIGYTSDAVYSAYKAWYCQPGSTWTSLGSSYARCCPTATTNCLIATACVNTSVLVGPRGEQVETCKGENAQTTCLVGTVYDHVEQTQHVLNYDCWPSYTAEGTTWDATKVTIQAAATDSAQTQTTDVQGPITSPPTYSTLPSSQNDNDDPSSGLSPGVVAGIVLGAVAGVVAVIAIGVQFLFLNKRNKAPPATEPNERIIYVQAAKVDEIQRHEGMTGFVNKPELDGNAAQSAN